MATSTRPIILFLSIGEKWMQDMCNHRTSFSGSLDDIQKQADLVLVDTAEIALDYLDQNIAHPPDGILVTDPGLAQPGSKKLLDRVVAYARAGGTVVMSYYFSSHLRMDVMRDFWKAWDLPWEPASFLRACFVLNKSTSTLRGNVAALHELYRQKALSLMNVEREHSWYLPTDNAVTESIAFPPEYQNETVVAFAPVGQGHVGYTGDVDMW